MLWQSEINKPNIITRDGSIDTQAEIIRMQRVVRKDCQFHYIPLTPQCFKNLPEKIAHAAQAGHWVLLDHMESIKDRLPELQRFLF